LSQKDIEAEHKARMVKTFCEAEHGLFQHIDERVEELGWEIIAEDDEQKRNLLWVQARCYTELMAHYKTVVNNGAIASAQMEAELRKQETLQ
jgi:hypothetical protein